MEVGLILAVMFGCPLLVAAVVVATGVTIGLRRRTRLEHEITAREQRVAHLLTVTTPELGPGRQVTLVIGAVVYAPDPVARFVHGWRRTLGGRSTSMTLRMEAARRLATVRALEHASQLGARAVLNLRYQSSALNQANRRSRRLPLIEIIAYGTAWAPARADTAAMPEW